MRVLITGDKGFVGTHMRRVFDEQGIEYAGYDLVDKSDIRDVINLDMAFRQLTKDSIVIHLAALAGVREGENRPDEYLSTNVVGTQNVITMCKRYGIKHLISFSSSSVLGNQHPAEGGSLETDPMKPIAVYGISKMCGEKLVEHSGVQSSIIRPFTLYGENGRPEQVIYKWINCIKEKRPIPFFGDGNTKRGYTYVGDLIDGIIKLIGKIDEGAFDNERFTSQVYNMGGHEITSLNALYALFTSVVGEVERDVQDLPNGDAPENWANVTKASNVFSFVANTDFNTKVAEIINKEITK